MSEQNSSAPSRPVEAQTPNHWLILSAQSLLDLDAKGCLVPHGIGGHARRIIEEFLKLHAVPAPADTPATPKEQDIAVAGASRPVEAQPNDTQLLDWLEARRIAFNRHYSTEYGWKFVTSPHVNRLHVADCAIDLNDANAKGTDIRTAIRAVMGVVPAPPADTPATDLEMCPDCPPVGYPTDATRCYECPRRALAPDSPVIPDSSPERVALRIAKNMLVALRREACNDEMPELSEELTSIIQVVDAAVPEWIKADAPAVADIWYALKPAFTPGDFGTQTVNEAGLPAAIRTCMALSPTCEVSVIEVPSVGITWKMAQGAVADTREPEQKGGQK